MISLIAAHEMFLRSLEYLKERKEHLEDLGSDMEQIRYDIADSKRNQEKKKKNRHPFRNSYV